MLNRYFDRMARVVVDAGGLVNKYGGDSLLAVFGSPLNPTPDHAARAVRAALAMLDALADFNHEQRAMFLPEIMIGIGVASGDVVAGNVGISTKLEYTAIGDAANVASRLQALTKELGESVLVTAETLGVAARRPARGRARGIAPEGSRRSRRARDLPTTLAPPPAGLSILNRPPRASTRSTSPLSPDPATGAAPPDAVVGDLDDEQSVRAPCIDLGARRVRVLEHVRERLADDEVRSRSPRAEPSGRVHDLRPAARSG